jgi:hypothetical protein
VENSTAAFYCIFTICRIENEKYLGSQHLSISLEQHPFNIQNSGLA